MSKDEVMDQIMIWRSKAEKWDELEEEISMYYEGCDDDGNETPPAKEGDLTDIGQLAAAAFGFY